MTSTTIKIKVIRRLVEKVESAFDSSTYQSSYETELHGILKKAFKQLRILEKELS